jgi:hypothetical protein
MFIQTINELRQVVATQTRYFFLVDAEGAITICEVQAITSDGRVQFVRADSLLTEAPTLMQFEDFRDQYHPCTNSREARSMWLGIRLVNREVATAARGCGS